MIRKAYFIKAYGAAGLRKLKTNKRVRWSPVEIVNGIRQYSTSTKAYRERIALGDPLPAVRTLQKLMQKVQFNRGFLDAVFEIMARKAYSKQEKVCVLMADEMKVKELYEWDRGSDTLIKPPAQAQTLYVRGLAINWQQPIFVDYDTKLTKELIQEAVTRLQKIGYHVAAFVTDLRTYV